MEKLLLDSSEVAAMLGVNQNAVGVLVSQGLLPFCLMGNCRKRKFKTSDVKRYVESLPTFTRRA